MIRTIPDTTSFKRLPVEEARAIVLSKTRLLPLERISIVESYGRVLAQDIASDIDLSPFDNSAMDGFAVRFEDFEAARPQVGNPLRLRIVGVLGAGDVSEKPLQAGEALRIMTGAPLPPGADTIIRAEDATVLGESVGCPEGHEVLVSMMPEFQSHVRFKGEEAKKGEVLLRAGNRISSPDVGLLASAGSAEVSVYRRPRVAIISTGSELVSVTDIPGPGQIRNSNSCSIAASVVEAGGIPSILPAVKDSLDVLVAALKHAVSEYDFVVTSGGAADGDFDFITTAAQKLGQLFFSRINMKPGKSQIFALIDGTPLFGLPGNPGAASVGFELLVRPALRKAQGHTAFDRPITKAALTESLAKTGDSRRVYLHARLGRISTGEYVVTPDPNQSSALLGALNRSNCLAIVFEGHGPFSVGDTIDCLRLDMKEGTI
jgi:molybdopterin molybdotransferase